MFDTIRSANKKVVSQEGATFSRFSKWVNRKVRDIEESVRKFWSNFTTETLPSLFPVDRARLFVDRLGQKLALGSVTTLKVIKGWVKELISAAYEIGSTLADRLLSLFQDGVKVATVSASVISFHASGILDRITSYLSNFAAQLQNSFQFAMSNGFGVGKVIDAVRSVAGGLLGKIQSLIKTESVSAVNRGAAATYQRNNVPYIIRIGILDERICGYCSDRVGRIFPADTEIALHPGDRCYSIPYSPKWKDTFDFSQIRKHREEAQAQTPPNSGLSPFEKLNGVKFPIRGFDLEDL